MTIQNMSLLLCFIIVFMGFCFDRKKIKLRIAEGRTVGLSRVYLCFTVLILIIVSGLRGDFSTDYVNYDWLFRRGFAERPLIRLLEERDFGFAAISRLIFQINQSTVVFMTVMAAVMMICYYKVFKVYSEDYLLSLMIFVVLDNYFISFNLLRNTLVCALYLVSSKFVYEKKLPQYILSVLCMAAIHRSAVLMIPMYWVLRFDYRKRNHRVIAVPLFIIAVFFMVYFREIVFLVQRVIGYQWDESMYGTDQGSFGSLVKTLILFAVVVLNIRKLHYSDLKERVWFHGCVMNVFFQICSYRLFMMQRIGFYFSGFFLLLIPLLISRNCCKNRLAYKHLMIAFLIAYSILFRNQIYYTFMDNKFL